jgi:hypothetical protein
MPAIGVLRLRGNFAERSFHSAQDDKLLRVEKSHSKASLPLKSLVTVDTCP